VALALAVAPATAEPTRAAYFGACTADDGYSPTYHVFRNVAGRQYTQVIARTIIRQLNACEPGSDSFSAVMAINLQDADCVPFVQFGYGEIQGGQPLTWLLTQQDNSCGIVTQQSLGCFPVISPVLGHNVQFEIYKPNTTQWQFHLSDLTTGCGSFYAIADHGDYTSMVWYGIETHNNNDQFGGAGSAARAQLFDMGYQYNGDGTTSYTYLTGTTSVAWANNGVIPYYWFASISTVSGRTTISGYTINH
jgi:hypothetical protein